MGKIPKYDAFQEYKEMYHFELKRKNELTNRLSIPIGIVIVVFGGLFYIFKNISKPFDLLEIIELALSSISCIFILIAVYFLVRSYFNYAYGYVPTAQQIENWRNELLEYYEQLEIELPDEEADKHVKDHLRNKYAEHAHRNTLNNDNKSTFLHKANLTIICSIVFIFVCGIIFVINSYSTL